VLPRLSIAQEAIRQVIEDQMEMADKEEVLRILSGSERQEVQEIMAEIARSRSQMLVALAEESIPEEELRACVP